MPPRSHATTVHRLLGWRPGTTTRFRHDRLRRLPHDVVVVDESSMVSLSLMARLLEALRPTARLVLVGDPDQLASVEAGAVLGDLVAALPRGVVRLTQAHRYGPALAGSPRPSGTATRTPRSRSCAPATSTGRSSSRPTTACPPQDVAGLRADVDASGRALVEAARAGDAPAALRALGTHRLLLAHREGPFGLAHWAATAETWVGSGTGQWPLGRPLLVTENDRASGLFNGDTGV